MRDPIERQSAIDAVNGVIADYIPILYGRYEALPLEMAMAIKRLPTAQPEIVRCKDCRYGVDYYHEGDCYCSNPKWGLEYFGGSWEFYCADAERRTDEQSNRCGCT